MAFCPGADNLSCCPVILCRPREERSLSQWPSGVGDCAPAVAHHLQSCCPTFSRQQSNVMSKKNPEAIEWLE